MNLLVGHPGLKLCLILTLWQQHLFDLQHQSWDQYQMYITTSTPFLFGIDGNGSSLATTQAPEKCAETLSDQVGTYKFLTLRVTQNPYKSRCNHLIARTHLCLLPWRLGHPPPVVVSFLRAPVVGLPTTPMAKSQAGANVLLKETVRHLVLYKNFVSTPISRWNWIIQGTRAFPEFNMRGRQLFKVC